MAYNAKTNWKYNDTPTESDLNRIEQGIKDLDDSVDSHKSALTLDHPDGSVTTSKLAAKSVTQDKIADKAVGSGQLADGAATDTVIGTRAIDDSVAAAAGADTPTRLWSKLANMVKGITGKSNWFTPPATTLEAVNSELSAKDAVPITIRQGVNIYNVDRKSRLQNLQITGRTLVNLLGRDGNCEDASAWIDYQSTHTVSTDNFFIGTSSIKVVISAGYTIASAVSNRSKVSLDANKYYLLAGRIKNGNATGGCFGVSGQSSTKTPVVTDTTKFGFTYKKFTGITTSSVGIEITATGTAGTYVFGDAVRLYEITKAEFDALDTMTADQIDAKYPYVDDVKSVNAVYMSNPGKNILPPFLDWIYSSTAAVYSVTNAYTLSFSGNGTSNVSLGVIVPVAAKQTYTVSVNSGGRGKIGLNAYDSTGTLLDSSVGAPFGVFTASDSITFTTPTGCASLKVSLYRDGTVAEPLVFTNPTLNLGSIALPFEPQQASYTYLPDCNLRSSVDGSVADQLYMRDGQPRAIRRFKEMVVDGTLGWVPDNTYAGFKTVRFNGLSSSIIMDPRDTGVVIKYNGAILVKGSSLNADAIDWDAAGWLFISVANNDTGWGTSYTPSVDEIKAYFNGWIMAATDGGLYSSGTKRWYAKWSTGAAWNPSAEDTYNTGTVPARMAPAGFTPYRLIYRLAQNVDEPINFEGSLMVHDGLNQIEMGTGIVVRDAASPKAENATYTWINIVNSYTAAASQLSYRVASFLGVYRNGRLTSEFVPTISAYRYGSIALQAYTPLVDFGASYSSTYKALDIYLLGIAPQSVSYSYAPNIKETVDTLARDVVEARTQISILQNTKAQKQKAILRITPTLLNGWTSYGISDPRYTGARYFKDDFGFVHLEGLVTGGGLAAGTVIFVLAPGYRPKYQHTLATITRTDAGVEQIGRITITVDGQVMVAIAGSAWLVLDTTPFLAEQ